MNTDRLITRRTVMSATCVATVAAMMSPAPTAEAKTDLGRPRVMWQQCVERALQCFPTGGGYHTGRNIPPGFRQTAWRIGPCGSGHGDWRLRGPLPCDTVVLLLSHLSFAAQEP